jgi:hypothetical protein
MGRYKILEKILGSIQIAFLYLFFTCFSFITAEVLIKYIEDNSLIVNIIIKKFI